MKGFKDIFCLEWRAMVRSGTLLLLSVASVVWMIVAPHIFRTDGTSEGAREMCLRFSLGGVVTLLAVSLLISAAGSISRERKAKRLQLTQVRPVRFFTIALGKIVALTLVGAVVLGLATAVEAVRQDSSRSCFSVHRPKLPSPREEAAAMYDAYMADPETPDAVKKAKKSVVMRLLTQRAIDHYQTIPTNSTVTWQFSPSTSLITPHSSLLTPHYSLRFRFTNMFNMRDEVRGSITTSIGATASVSNITQAIVTIPLNFPLLSPPPPTFSTSTPNSNSQLQLNFSNSGNRAVMLRPRKDIELLVRADSFLPNLLRAYLELVSLLALLIAFGVFLGAALSRPVAIFVAVVTLALSEMSPSVIEQYPDELETDRIDAIGLSLARFSAAVTHPIGSLSPLSELSADNRIEPSHVVRTVLTDFVLLPLILALLSALAIPNKKED